MRLPNSPGLPFFLVLAGVWGMVQFRSKRMRLKHHYGEFEVMRIVNPLEKVAQVRLR
jgi:hypothetical protein